MKNNFESQREIHHALWVDGETVIGEYKFKVIDDSINIMIDNVWAMTSESFFNFKTFEIYHEPKWYENIPEAGTFVIDEDGNMYVMFKVEEYDLNRCIKPPRRLTKQEIQVYLDNAPEGEEDE